MLALLKTRNPYEKSAEKVYRLIVEQVRQPSFYKEYAVPDSFDGRFDLLLIHLFIVMHAILQKSDNAEARGFNQALFDVAFADMAQLLRQQGIGDMGIPKHMRRMMKAFNGRMHVYSATLGDDQAFEGALRRNLYATSSGIADENVCSMRLYIQKNLEIFEHIPVSMLMQGEVKFLENLL